MTAVLGEVLTSAVGVAVSPVPLIAAVLMLMSPSAGRTAPAFLAGWVVGIALALGVFVLGAGLLPDGGQDGSRPVVAVVQLVLGVLLLLLGVKQWRGRPRPGEEPELPAWMAGVDSFSPGRSFALAAALAALNPKNLMLTASAGVSIAQADEGTATTVVVAVVWTVLAASSVAVPVVGALVAPARARRVLVPLRVWLESHNAAVMTVLLVLLGTNVLGKGMGGL